MLPQLEIHATRRSCQKQCWRRARSVALGRWAREVSLIRPTRRVFFDSLEATLDPAIDGSMVGGAKGDFFKVSLSVEGSNCQLDGTQEISVDKAQVQSVQLLVDRHVGDEGQATSDDPPTDPGEEATEAPHLSRSSPTEQEAALARVKTFCANVLRMLAPPLLKEVQSVTRLSVDEVQETPRRLTHSSGVRRPVSKPLKKASAAESVLLKVLGIMPANLEVDERALQDFCHLFDSPLQEQHLRAIAAIFGKVVPPEVLMPGIDQGGIGVY
jgi:hypothetical protein